MEIPPQNATVLDGKDATITCRAAGAPTPNITWIYQSMFAYMSYYKCQLLKNL
jgi:protein sidekick